MANYSIKTSTFTAADGEGYFVDTLPGGAVTANLPAGTAGAIVAFKDYAKTFDSTNKLTLVQNGSDKVGGSTVNRGSNNSRNSYCTSFRRFTTRLVNNR